MELLELIVGAGVVVQLVAAPVMLKVTVPVGAPRAVPTRVALKLNTEPRDGLAVFCAKIIPGVTLPTITVTADELAVR